MKLQPKEIWTVKYWIHLLLIVLVVFGMINVFLEPMPIDFKTVFFGGLFIGIGDIISHSILNLP